MIGQIPWNFQPGAWLGICSPGGAPVAQNAAPAPKIASKMQPQECSIAGKVSEWHVTLGRAGQVFSVLRTYCNCNCSNFVDVNPVWDLMNWSAHSPKFFGGTSSCYYCLDCGFQANQPETDTVFGQAMTFNRRRVRCRDGQIDSKKFNRLVDYRLRMRCWHRMPSPRLQDLRQEQWKQILEHVALQK